MDETMLEITMSIIMKAGDARVYVKQALDDMEHSRYPEAKAKLDQAQTCIGEAHSAQTEVIQGEARGEHHEFSLLFTHAQDTLMTIFSELNIARSLYGIIMSLDTRISHLERI